MRIYPALKSRMGDWSYYIVRMRMQELASEISFSSDIYDDYTLGDAIQRALDESRVKKQIINFLAKRDDRFFSSLVVAAIGGDPRWYSVKMDEKVVPEMIADSDVMKDSFGILSFDKDPKYYALDGQHRLAAIKMLLEQKEGVPKLPPGFENEFVSVLVVLRRPEDKDEKQWRRRYRRLFSSLNRYAKPTDRDTNIIMDEDDSFAIVTRRLISEHDFFRAPGKEKDSFRVQTSGKNFKDDSPHFISLQALYDVNRMLLSSKQRRLTGWGTDGAKEKDVKQFIAFRPEEDVVDGFYEEAARYWDALLDTLPDLKKKPRDMRKHDESKRGMDHAAFWPIGQEVLAEVTRDLLDARVEDASTAKPSALKAALAPLAFLPWDLHEVPWRGLLLVEDKGVWKMRSEGRKPAVEAAKKVIRWLLGLDDLDGEELEALEADWASNYYPNLAGPAATKTWDGLVALRKKIQKKL